MADFYEQIKKQGTDNITSGIKKFNEEQRKKRAENAKKTTPKSTVQTPKRDTVPSSPAPKASTPGTIGWQGGKAYYSDTGIYPQQRRVYTPLDSIEMAASTAADKWAQKTFPQAPELDFTKYKQTSPFGQNNGLKSAHNGIDYGTPMNTPVGAIANGTVIQTGNAGTYGNLVKVRFDDGNIGYYSHLNSFNVKAGDKVRAGDILGTSGNTGRSTGPHLHLEVRGADDNYYNQIDPQKYIDMYNPQPYKAPEPLYYDYKTNTAKTRDQLINKDAVISAPPQNYNKIEKQEIKNPTFGNDAGYVAQSALAGLSSAAGGMVDALVTAPYAREIEKTVGTGNKPDKNSSFTDKLLHYAKNMWEKTADYMIQRSSLGTVYKTIKTGLRTYLSNKYTDQNAKKEGFENAEEMAKADIEKAYGMTDFFDKPANKLAFKQIGVSDGAKFTGELTQTISYMVPSIAVSLLTKNPNIATAMMATSAGGNAAKEAYKNGATAEQAYYNGILKGTAEYLTEKMFGGIPALGKGILGKNADDIIAKLSKSSIGKFLNSSYGKVVMELLDRGGEGLEEAITGLASGYIDRLTYNDQAELATAKELGRDFYMGVLVSFVMNAPMDVVKGISNIKSNATKTVESYPADVKEITPAENTEAVEDVSEILIAEDVDPNKQIEEELYKMIENGNISSAIADQIASDTQLRSGFERMSNVSVEGSKAEKRNAIKNWVNNSQNIENLKLSRAGLTSDHARVVSLLENPNSGNVRNIIKIPKLAQAFQELTGVDLEGDLDAQRNLVKENAEQAILNYNKAYETGKPLQINTNDEILTKVEGDNRKAETENIEAELTPPPSEPSQTAILSALPKDEPLTPSSDKSDNISKLMKGERVNIKDMSADEIASLEKEYGFKIKKQQQLDNIADRKALELRLKEGEKKLEDEIFENIDNSSETNNGILEENNIIKENETSQSARVLNPQEAQVYNIVTSNLKRQAEESGILTRDVMERLQDVDAYNPSVSDIKAINNEMHSMFDGTEDAEINGYLNSLDRTLEKAKTRQFNFNKAKEKYSVDTTKEHKERYEAYVDEVFTDDEATAKAKAENRDVARILEHTPEVILDYVNECKDLPVVMNYTKLYLALRENGVINGHYHNLGAEVGKKLPELMSNPDAIIQLDNGRLNILTEIKTEKGNNGIISVEMNSVKDIDGKYSPYNVVITMMSSKDTYVKNLISKPGTAVKYIKEDLLQVNPQLYNWLAIINNKSSVKHSITHKGNTVNTNSMQNLKMYSVKRAESEIVEEDSKETDRMHSTTKGMILPEPPKEYRAIPLTKVLNKQKIELYLNSVRNLERIAKERGIIESEPNKYIAEDLTVADMMNINNTIHDYFADTRDKAIKERFLGIDTPFSAAKGWADEIIKREKREKKDVEDFDDDAEIDKTVDISEESEKNIPPQNESGSAVTEDFFDEAGAIDDGTPNVLLRMPEPPEASRKTRLEDIIDYATRKLVDSGNAFARIGKIVNDDALYSLYDLAKRGRTSAMYCIEKAQKDINGKTVGKSLAEIFQPVLEKGDEYHKEFSEYLFHMHNIDRMKMYKYVFGRGVTAKMSRAEAERLLKKHPEFADIAEEVYDYANNELQYAADSGLISKSYLKWALENYPHYVPTYRYRASQFGGQRRAKKNKGLTDLAVTAPGGEETLMPIYESLKRKTLRGRNQGQINVLLNRVLAHAVSNKEKMAPFVSRVTIGENETDDANTYEFYRNGKKVTLHVSDSLMEGIKSLSADYKEPSEVEEWVTKVNNVYKASITSWNPAFIATNFLKDIQDVTVYSKDLSKFPKAYKKAWEEMVKGGEMWQLYCYLGGFDSGIIDEQTGLPIKHKGLKKLTDRINVGNYLVEQAPRFAEFLATVENGGMGRDNLAQAMLNSANVTVNFNRSGTLVKALNKSFVPFLNPSVQGVANTFRVLKENKDFKDWGKLALKAVIFGVAPTVINNLLYWDDEDFQNLNPRDRDTNYIFKIPNWLTSLKIRDWEVFGNLEGKFLKIPKGRFLSSLGMPVNAIFDLAKGKDVNVNERLSLIWDNLGPVNPLTSNIATPIVLASMNRTWYGGEIEPQGMDNVPDYQKYDASTSAIAKAIGRVLDISPMRIDYVLDSYSGVFGDFILPMTSEKGGNLIEPISKKFVIDPVYSNRISKDYYDKKNYWEKMKNNVDNDKQSIAAVISRYLNSCSSAVSNLNKEIRELEALDANGLVGKGIDFVKIKTGIGEASGNITKKEKLEKLKEVRVIKNATLKTMTLQLPDVVKSAHKLYSEADLKQYIAKYGKDGEQKYIDYLYREMNKETFGAEYALQIYNKDTYKKAQNVAKQGVSYDSFYNCYFGFKELGEDATNDDKRRWLMNSSDFSTGEKKILDANLISRWSMIKNDKEVDYSNENTFILSQMSESAQRKKSRFPNMSADRYSELYKAYSSGDKKADKIKNLVNAGLSPAGAEQFYKTISKK